MSTINKTDNLDTMKSLPVESFNAQYGCDFIFDEPENVRVCFLNDVWFLVYADGRITKHTRDFKKFNEDMPIRNLTGNTCCGYLQVRINKILYRLHRIIYKAFNPEIDIKDLVIDHINNVHSDNRIDNLRLLTQEENIRLYHNSQQLEIYNITYDEIKQYIIDNYTDLHNLPNYKKLMYLYNENIKYIGYKKSTACLFYSVMDDLKQLPNHV